MKTTIEKAKEVKPKVLFDHSTEKVLKTILDLKSNYEFVKATSRFIYRVLNLKDSGYMESIENFDDIEKIFKLPQVSIENKEVQIDFSATLTLLLVFKNLSVEDTVKPIKKFSFDEYEMLNTLVSYLSEYLFNCKWEDIPVSRKVETFLRLSIADNFMYFITINYILSEKDNIALMSAKLIEKISRENNKDPIHLFKKMVSEIEIEVKNENKGKRSERKNNENSNENSIDWDEFLNKITKNKNNKNNNKGGK